MFTNSYVDKATTEVHCYARVLGNNTHDHGSVCAPNKLRASSTVSLLSHGACGYLAFCTVIPTRLTAGSRAKEERVCEQATTAKCISTSPFSRSSHVTPLLPQGVKPSCSRRGKTIPLLQG